MSGKAWARLAAGAIIVGSVLTWLTVQAGMFSLSKNGFEGDGKLTIVLGILGLILMQGNTKTRRNLAIACGVISAATVSYDLIDAFKLADETVSVSPGIGLILVGVGGVGLAITSRHIPVQAPPAPSAPGTPLPPPTI